MATKRYYLGDVITFTVRSIRYESPIIGRRASTNEYLILWDSGWPLNETNIRERWEGFDLTSGYHGRKVSAINASQIVGLAADKKEQMAGLKCHGPCQNFIHGATVDSDPDAKGDKDKWWCRTDRKDYGWMRNVRDEES
jgi:hypothetical protein